MPFFSILLRISVFLSFFTVDSSLPECHQMLWFIAFIALNFLVQCTGINPPRTDTRKRLTTEAEKKIPNIVSRQTMSELQTLKTTSKSSSQKPVTPAPLNEFSLNDILFRGRQSNEANTFLKANEQRGKQLETTYEHIREQDLDDIEALVRRRSRLRFFRH
ncbi:hypothetical protein AWC38_SpisGene13700 [Stylophora pistillata]|uniref:Uncharacterized protein n=1 Tax=Stylophora pistillata TaxID=50429 RepID=A0A2B4RTM0_STYPI|nr:hypothetical protein AWC38_SpisGene13700 [Stylophora pistillata]